MCLFGSFREHILERREEKFERKFDKILAEYEIDTDNILEELSEKVEPFDNEKNRTQIIRIVDLYESRWNKRTDKFDDACAPLIRKYPELYNGYQKNIYSIKREAKAEFHSHRTGEKSYFVKNNDDFIDELSEKIEYQVRSHTKKYFKALLSYLASRNISTDILKYVSIVSAALAILFFWTGCFFLMVFCAIIFFYTSYRFFKQKTQEKK